MAVVRDQTIFVRNELAEGLGTPAVGPQLNFSYEIPRTNRDEFDATVLLKGGTGVQ